MFYDLKSKIRKGDSLLGIALALVTCLFTANILAPNVFVVYKYGWKKVCEQHLEILHMPKGMPWPISNGEYITDDFFICYLMGLLMWFFLLLITYFPLRLLLPLKIKE